MFNGAPFIRNVHQKPKIADSPKGQSFEAHICVGLSGKKSNSNMIDVSKQPTLNKSKSDKALNMLCVKSPSTTKLITAYHLRNLTSTQKLALQSTWKQIKDNNGIRLIERIFHKLTVDDQNVRELFYKVVFLTMMANHSSTITTCRDHANVFFKLLDDMINNIDECDALLTTTSEFGAKHAFLKKSGLKTEVWEKFGEIAVDVIISQSYIRTNMDASRAWTVLLACITDELCQGFKRRIRIDTLTDVKWQSCD